MSPHLISRSAGALSSPRILELPDRRVVEYRVGETVYVGAAEITADILDAIALDLMELFDRSGESLLAPAIKSDGTRYREKVITKSFDSSLYRLACRASAASKRLKATGTKGGELFHGFSTFHYRLPEIGEYIYIHRGVRVYSNRFWVPKRGFRCIFPSWVRVTSINLGYFSDDQDDAPHVPGKVNWEGGAGNRYWAYADDVVYQRYKRGTPASPD